MRTPNRSTRPAGWLAMGLAIYSTFVVPVLGSLSSESAVAAPAGAALPGFALGAKPSSDESSMSLLPADIAPDGSSLVTVRLPVSAKLDSLKVFLNGAEITRRFDETSCPDALCMTARIGPLDGLRAGKNVFQAEGRSQSGAVLTARSRFDARAAAEVSAQRKLGAQAKQGRTTAGVQLQAMTVSEPFLPPTVGLMTLNDGGYNYGQGAWLQIGDTQYPTSTPSCSGSAIWTVIVLDRQTLEEKTGAPENSPKCIDTNANLAAYLESLPDGDLVIAGPNFGQSPDGASPLDTSAIGGTNYAGAGDFAPASYMIIGATGATPGTAFEPHDIVGHTSGWSSAQGILQEDANGNYNFLPGMQDFVRFAVVPNSPAGMFNNRTSPSTSIQLSLTAEQQAQYPNLWYMSYVPPLAAQDGFWLMRFNRRTLEPLDSCSESGTIVANIYFLTGCGRFYATNTAKIDFSTAVANMRQLASDLQAVNNDPWQLMVLTTVGQATCCDWDWAMGGGGNGNTAVGYDALYPVLWSLGGTPAYTTYYADDQNSSVTPVPAYTLVSAGGLGTPLGGTSVESSTALLKTHGQTGTVSGSLERNNYAGLFTPGQVNQEFTSVLIAKGGLDNQFMLNRVALQAPVDWPAESQTKLLSGADSIEGQISAYRFVSYSLLRDKYAVGISGSHQDDLHYFFTGSLNSSINYHYFDPKDLPWPGSGTPGFTQCSSVSGTTCTFQLGGDSLVFTTNDFNAVISQTSQEVRYLTNVLQYLVSGSTNMRDTIIGGNANVGLALTGAAATVLGNQLLPQATVVTDTIHISWQSILGMVNGLLTVAAGIPGIGELYLAEETIQESAKLFSAVKQAGAWSNEVAGAAGLASGAGGIVSTTTTTTSSLPAKYSKFALTVGQLASGALQDQLAHGFDAMVDSITSDWGRLLVIGPRIVNVDDEAFFVPNQVVQETVLDGITSGAQRQFYAALLPSFFEVHYWPTVQENTYDPLVSQPDMGYYKDSSGGGTCWAFYLDPHQPAGYLGTIAPYTSAYVPYARGLTNYFSQMDAKYDYYIIAKPSDSKGSDTEVITPLDATFGAALFSPQGLNIPILQFMHPYGPMQSVWRNAGTTSDITTHANSSICPANDYGPTDGVGADPSPVIPNPEVLGTSTSLSGPFTAKLYDPVQFTATVKSGEALVDVGMMYFRIDGRVAASVPMQSDGTATLEVDELGVGSHTIKASYGTAAGSAFAASSSTEQALTIYSSGPDFRLSSSTSSLSVKRGSTSQAATISVASMNGAEGDVKFACSGLPMGATCQFAPSQLSITDGGTVTTTMTVSTVNGAALGLLGLLLLPFVGAGPARRRRLLVLSTLMGVAAVTSLSGCNDEKKSYEVPTGTAQVLVSATIGDVTRTMPMTVTISN